MINKRNSPINSLETIIDSALNILQGCKKIPQMYDSSFDEHQKTCHRIMEDIHSNRLKIAVAGTIKSGKSTFINSLVGKDLVKRGAGVVTSITTRIKKGKKNRANIYFKSWDAVNNQLQKALELFPDDGAGYEFQTANLSDFDIRRKKDRELLKKVFKILTCDFPVTQKGIQPETLLIKHALQGFDTCKEFVQADEICLTFEKKKFDKYKIFISDPDKAFYIKDVCLEIYGKIIDPNIEIADCQGADSIDPHQLGQILNYLESSNLIIYCISSRTGLRQADIIFLNQIKNLGLIDNIIFINNCDFSEHENFDDLFKIETSIKENIEFLEINPKIFSLSSLYNLFKECKAKLNNKDLIRLKLWQEEKKTIKYCDLQTKEFNLFFRGVIDKNRYDFLISNHFNRLAITLSHLEQQTKIFSNLLSSDKQEEKKAIKTIYDLEQNAARLESIVKKSIKSCIKDLKEKIHSNQENAFMREHKALLNNTLEYINNASSIDVEQYKTTTDESFNQILYLMFQDFKRKLDLYVLENVMPELKRFVKTQEEEIISYFYSLFDSFQIDLVKDYDISGVFKDLPNPAKQYIGSVSLEKIKKILGIKMPATVFEAKYTSKIRANVLTDFGVHTLSGILSILFKQKRVFSFSPGLNKAAIKIRQENLKLIKTQFKQYYINLETDYFIPLIEAVTRDFEGKINKQFALYYSYKSEAEHIFSLKQSQREEQKKQISLIQKEIEQQIIQCNSFFPMGLRVDKNVISGKICL